ncbi:hypothetical protein PM082_009359 [Marasmius tenuissimus]|nr:hypothetical protein PM082_009359 [Marasmius tenuissimus]
MNRTRNHPYSGAAGYMYATACSGPTSCPHCRGLNLNISKRPGPYVQMKSILPIQSVDVFQVTWPPPPKTPVPPGSGILKNPSTRPKLLTSKSAPAKIDTTSAPARPRPPEQVQTRGRLLKQAESYLDLSLTPTTTTTRRWLGRFKSRIGRVFRTTRKRRPSAVRFAGTRTHSF